MRGIKALSSLEDVIVICAELKDMRYEPYQFYDKWTSEQRIAHKGKINALDKLGFQLLADLLNSRKVTQKEYWAAYCAWYRLWSHDFPYWDNDENGGDYCRTDALYEKYNPTDPDLTIDDFF
jgi:hypothetical protein